MRQKNISDKWGGGVSKYLIFSDKEGKGGGKFLILADKGREWGTGPPFFWLISYLNSPLCSVCVFFTFILGFCSTKNNNNKLKTGRGLILSVGLDFLLSWVSWPGDRIWSLRSRGSRGYKGTRRRRLRNCMWVYYFTRVGDLHQIHHWDPYAELFYFLYDIKFSLKNLN